MPYFQPTYRLTKIIAGCLLLCCLQLNLFAEERRTHNTEVPPVGNIFFPEMHLLNAGDSSSFVVPFSRVGNLLLIRARADTAAGNFILDTGCPGLVLNITYFRNYPITNEANTESQGMTGGWVSRQQTTVRSFTFGTQQQRNVPADLANLGAIENSKGVKILGLIGMLFLKNCEMIIDYQQNLVYFHIMGKKQERNYKSPHLTDTSEFHILPFELTDDRIIVRTTVAGKKLKFVIDCAAETNVFDSRLPDKIFETLSVTGRVSLIGVGNQKVEAVKGNLASFSIGGRDITALPVLITNLEKTCFAAGGCVDGVLGINELSVKKIGFNFTTNKMYLWK